VDRSHFFGLELGYRERLFREERERVSTIEPADHFRGDVREVDERRENGLAPHVTRFGQSQTSWWTGGDSNL
jgi:hypothetical protein